MLSIVSHNNYLQVLLYNPLRGTPWLSRACALLMFLSFFFGITAVALMWRTSPNEYPYGGLLNDSMFFFRSVPGLAQYAMRSCMMLVAEACCLSVWQ